MVGGPTAAGQPPFEWSEQWAHLAHHGMPQRFDFAWERVSPEALPLPSECPQRAAAAVAVGGGAVSGEAALQAQ